MLLRRVRVHCCLTSCATLCLLKLEVMVCFSLHISVSLSLAYTKLTFLPPSPSLPLAEEVSDAEKLRTFLSLGSPSAVQIMTEINRLGKASNLSAADRTKLLAGAFFADLASVRKQIAKYKGVLAKVLGNDTAQQSVFLTAIEDLFEAQEMLDAAETARFLKQVPLVLKDLYDNDIIDEDVILKWAKGTSAAGTQLRKAAAAFVSWLETAEEESDDE